VIFNNRAFSTQGTLTRSSTTTPIGTDPYSGRSRLVGSNLKLSKSVRSQSFGTLGSGDDERDSGSVGRDDPDLFKFRITKDRRASLDVTNSELISSRYIRGSLLDDRKRTLKTTDKARAPLGTEDISLKLKSGTYYVKISTDGKKIFYRFKLSID
jgi:hypothetical protein